MLIRVNGETVEAVPSTRGMSTTFATVSVWLEDGAILSRHHDCVTISRGDLCFEIDSDDSERVLATVGIT